MPADPKPIVKPPETDQDEITSSMEGMDPADPHPAEEGDPYHNRRTDRPITEAKLTFSAQELAQIQRLLREAANEPVESFETEAAMGTLSEEIDTLRRNGMTNDDIAALLTQGAGATITAEQVAQLYGAASEHAR